MSASGRLRPFPRGCRVSGAASGPLAEEPMLIPQPTAICRLEKMPPTCAIQASPRPLSGEFRLGCGNIKYVAATCDSFGRNILTDYVIVGAGSAGCVPAA